MASPGASQAKTAYLRGMVDCTAILHTVIDGVNGDACAAARATIRAAEIQAKATRHAGTLTFIGAFIAGLSAVLGGGLVYIASLKQLRLDKDQQLARVLAYMRQIAVIVSRAKFELLSLMQFAKTYQFNTVDLSLLKDISTKNMSLLRTEFAPSNWERHAYLGQTSLHQAIKTHDCIEVLLKRIGYLTGLSEVDKFTVLKEHGNPERNALIADIKDACVNMSHLEAYINAHVRESQSYPSIWKLRLWSFIIKMRERHNVQRPSS